MSRIVVRVDGAGPSTIAKNEQALDLRTHGENRTVLVDPDQIVGTFLAEVPPRCRDLFHIAGAIYAADARTTRGRLTDVFNDAWRREFTFHIGVHDVAFWMKPGTLAALRNAVEFVSGDSIDFAFSTATAPASAKQSVLDTDLSATHWSTHSRPSGTPLMATVTGTWSPPAVYLMRLLLTTDTSKPATLSSARANNLGAWLRKVTPPSATMPKRSAGTG